LTPNDPYRGRTAPLTSKRCSLYIYWTNIGTEYFKHGIYSSLFPLQNAVCFIILIYLFPVLFAFYIQGVLKLKKTSTKRLINPLTPNDPYRRRTAPLTSKVAFYIFNKYRYRIFQTWHILSVFFFSSKCSLCHNSNVFGSCITFYMQDVLKLKKWFRRQKVKYSTFAWPPLPSCVSIYDRLNASVSVFCMYVWLTAVSICIARWCNCTAGSM